MNKMKYKSGGAKKKQLGGAGGYGMVMAQSELLKKKGKKKSASNESPRAKKQNTPQGSSAKNQEGSFIEPNKELQFGGVDRFVESRRRTMEKKNNIDTSKNLTSDGMSKPAPKATAKAAPAAEKKSSGPSFNTAFGDARKAGKKEFTWNGKKYNTRKAGESPEDYNKAMSKSSGSKANTTSGIANVGRPTQQGGNKKQPMSSMKSKSAGQISTGAKSVGLQKSSFTVPKAESKSDVRKAKRADRREGRKANRAAKSGSAVSRLLGSRKSMQNGGLKTPSEDQKGLQKLPTSVRNKMGYKKYGGKK